MLARLRLIWVLACIAGHLFWGVLIVAVLFPWMDAAARDRQVRRWARVMLRISGVRLQVRGADGAASVVKPGTMLLLNHISWLDVYAVNALQPTRFVAKSEIRGWPIIGYLCERTGIIFIIRSIRRLPMRCTATVRRAAWSACFPKAPRRTAPACCRFMRT